MLIKTLVSLSWQPISKFIKDEWLPCLEDHHYPLADYHNNQELEEEQIEVISHSTKQNANNLTLLEGRTIDTLLSKISPDADALYDFPRLGLSKEKLKNGELGMVYFPMTMGDLTAKYVVTSHDLKEVRHRKADVYGILSNKSYPNLDLYPDVVKSVSQFDGLNYVGRLDHYPETLFDCCRFMNVAGVPAAINETKV